jgi:hypothetical protein
MIFQTCNLEKLFGGAGGATKFTSSRGAASEDVAAGQLRSPGLGAATWEQPSAPSRVWLPRDAAPPSSAMNLSAPRQGHSYVWVGGAPRAAIMLPESVVKDETSTKCDGECVMH